MHARARLAVLACTLAPPAFAQPPQHSDHSIPRARPTAPTAAEMVRRLRCRADLDAVCADARRAASSFVGRVRFATPGDPAAAIGAVDERFEGGSDVGGAWFRILGSTCLQHGERRAYDADAGGWRAPDWGDPDVPVTPVLLLPHFLEADLGAPEPCMLDDRPAMRVHARFVGRAAKDVLMSTTMPSSRVEQVVEALATAASRDAVRYVVDATLVYDPAMRRWSSVTLRLANVDGRPIPADHLPPEAPANMPHLQSAPLIEATWHMRRVDAHEADRPALDRSARRLLGLPEDGTGRVR